MVMVLDSSGSMAGDDGSGSTRIASARKAVGTVVDALPDGYPTGLRVYGADKAKGCDDTRLAQPVAALDRAGIKQAVAGVRPKGDTPIGLSLRKAAGDLPRPAGGAIGKRTILLISDGEDNCRAPPPCKVAAQLAAVRRRSAHRRHRLPGGGQGPRTAGVHRRRPATGGTTTPRTPGRSPASSSGPANSPRTATASRASRSAGRRPARRRTRHRPRAVPGHHRARRGAVLRRRPGRRLDGRLLGDRGAPARRGRRLPRRAAHPDRVRHRQLLRLHHRAASGSTRARRR